MEAMKYLKIGKESGPSEVYAKMILASVNAETRVLMELCQRILDGKGMPADWATSVANFIFKGKDDIMNCGMHRGVKLLEHAMTFVEKVLKKRLRTIVTIDDMKFGFMPCKGRIDTVFMLRRIQEEQYAKQKK